jgi:5-methylcytosine-specific restriction endonuclease McrA
MEKYKFTKETKLRVMEQQSYCCDRCKKQFQYYQLQMHHRLPKAIAKKFFPHLLAVITHDANAQALCKNCHSGLHKEVDHLFDKDPSKDEEVQEIYKVYEPIIHALLGLAQD